MLNSERLAELKREFDEVGLVKIPGFYLQNQFFKDYIIDLLWATESLTLGKCVKRSENAELEELASCLEDKVINLDRDNPGKGRHLHGLTSHPGKLLSQNMLRHDADTMTVVKTLFGSDSVIGFPHMSDSLGIFYPQDPQKPIPYNQSLPIHQDFPYMMQSSKQLVIWIPISNYDEKTGGIEYWAASNKRNIVNQKGLGDYFEVAEDEVLKYQETTGNKPQKVTWDCGDLVIFDSNIFHRSIYNSSNDKCRITQIFRVSDLNSGDGISYDWRSTTYVDRNEQNPKAISFGDVYPDLVIEGS